jgi:hypothetical protein
MTLTDNLFGYLAQIGLHRTSLEMGEDAEEDMDFREAYDALIARAREGHEECVKIRNALLAAARNPDVEAALEQRDLP